MITKAELGVLFDKRAVADALYRELSRTPAANLDADIDSHRAYLTFLEADRAYLAALREFIETENPGVLVNIRQVGA